MRKDMLFQRYVIQYAAKMSKALSRNTHTFEDCARLKNPVPRTKSKLTSCREQIIIGILSLTSSKEGESPGPKAIWTRFGWVLSGPVVTTKSDDLDYRFVNLSSTNVLRVETSTVYSQRMKRT